MVVVVMCWTLGMAHGGVLSKSAVVWVQSVQPPGKPQLGFVVDKAGYVVTHKGVFYGREFKVTLGSGKVFKAFIVARDGVNHLLLLKLKTAGRALPAATFAKAPIRKGRQLYGVTKGTANGEMKVVKGELLKIATFQAEPSEIYFHDVTVGKVGMGSPLLNNCGEVAGVIIPSSQARRSYSGYANEPAEEAVPTAGLLNVFEKQGVSLKLKYSARPCLSAVEADAKAEAAKAEAAKKALQETEQRLIEQQNKAQIDGDVMEKHYQLWGMVITVGGLLLIFLIWFMKRRSLAKLKAEKALAEVQMQNAKSDLSSYQLSELERKRVPTLLLEWCSKEGKMIALRIPGLAIAESGGVVVGRNPTESDFVINHEEVSRQHFRLCVVGGAVVIEDLNSTNGTTLEGKELSPGQGEPLLQERYAIGMGDLQLELQLEQSEEKRQC